MLKTRKKIKLISPFSILIFVYLIWQFIGLRFTNHDDIFLHLSSWVFSDNYYEFAEYAAFSHSRIQSYINMPIILWVNYLKDTVIYDLLNLSSFSILYILLFWLVSRLSSIENALLLSMFTAILFPLHYYFTFPQAYPVMAVWPLIFLFISLILIDLNANFRSNLKLFGSIFLFTLSLFGPEYNFILHPVILVIYLYYLLFSNNPFDFKKIIKFLSPYIIFWIFSFAAYWSFSSFARGKNLDTVGRMSLDFNIYNLLKTFLILQEKSFLPIALIRGIDFGDASLNGGPPVPALLNYYTLIKGLSDFNSVFIILLISLVLFIIIFSFQSINIKFYKILLIFFLSMLTIPTLVVSASSHYQEIVLKGYLQGHLVTFYSYIGFSGLIFISFCLVLNSIKQVILKKLVLILMSTICSILLLFTFAYNNINRQTMMANKQKWTAFEELVTYIHNSRIDLKDKDLYAPNFWSSTGVSSIPGVSPFTSLNYWTDYSNKVLNRPIIFTNLKRENEDLSSFEISYSTNPSGYPISIIREFISGDSSHRYTLISASPLIGKIKLGVEDFEINDINIKNWSCNAICSYSFKSDKSKILILPKDEGPKSLLAQFIIKRTCGYGNPFIF